MNAINEKADDRREIEDLLPWHAAGTLNRRDADQVTRALTADPELARRFQLVREELGETIHLNESLGTPSARALAKLMVAIDAEPMRERSFSLANIFFDFGGRISEFLSGLSPRTLAWSATGAAVAILLQIGVITGVLMSSGAQQGGYQTASAPVQVQTEKGSFVLLRFTAHADADQITKFLEMHQASVVDGPKAGMYKVRVAVTSLPKDELGRIVKSMQDSKIVGFVAPTE